MVDECWSKVEQKLDKVFKRLQHNPHFFEERKAQVDFGEKFDPTQT